MGIDASVRRLGDRTAAGSGGGGPQARARNARYATLASAAQAAGATEVLTAHHADDQVTTRVQHKELGVVTRAAVCTIRMDICIRIYSYTRASV